MKNSKLEIDPSSGRLSYEDQDQKFFIDGKLVNQQFKGVVSLDNDLTHYQNYTVDTNIAITLDANPIIGGYAELTLIGNGTNSPTWSASFTATPNSVDFDATLNVVNKVGIYYDGNTAYYTITPIV